MIPCVPHQPPQPWMSPPSTTLLEIVGVPWFTVIAETLLPSPGFVSCPISVKPSIMVSRVILKGRRIGFLRPILDFLVTMPLGIPAVVFGVGFLFAYTQEPFFLYGTKWVIVLVYVTLMLPFTTRMQMAGMVSLGETYV